MKKSVFRILVCVLILSLALPAASNHVLAEGETPPVPVTSALEWEAINNLPERVNPDHFLLQEHAYPPELAEMFPGGVEELEPREYTLPSPEIIALTQQQVQSFSCADVTDVPVIECEALVALYNSTNGAGWTNSTNWLISSTVDDWYRVTVSNGHVTYLGLYSNNLNGSIPPELGNLTNLTDLYLFSNQLSGSIPSELGNLTYLAFIILQSNKLSGSIPPELGNLANLVSLNLCKNQLSGSIPSELGSMTNLIALSLQTNQLVGSIPHELGSLTNLTDLDLSYNQLSGLIPHELGNMTNLRYLYLGYNQLSGSVPLELGSLTNLKSLGLSSNQLSGSIPPELGNLSNLLELDLSSNHLSGSISPELGNLTNLERLALGWNNFSGEIPPFVGSLINLKSLGLGGNKFSGSIPSLLGSLTNLEWLYLSDNQLTGEIPASLGNLTNLHDLFLGGNNLFGSIPTPLSNLINLESLYLGSNNLSGEIPSFLGNLINLVRLDISDNQLSGNIPTELGNLTYLGQLYLNDNMLSGDVPPSFVNLTELCGPSDNTMQCHDGRSTLDLGYNRLNVPAPEPPANFLVTKDPDWYLTQAVEAEIPGETGGTVISNDGNTEIDIPADAVVGTFTILFAPQPNPSEDIGVLNFAGNSFELTASIGETPVTSFAQPLTLTLQYDEASLGVIPEDSLILYYWDTIELAWLDAASTCTGGTYIRNFDENWLRLPICHLSEFALLGDSFDLFLPSIRR